MKANHSALDGSHSLARRIFVSCAALLATTLAMASAKLFGQQDRGGEVAANLATGRVVFCVVHDAIVVAAIEGGGEVGSRPPAVVPVSAGRIGVLLGAVEWIKPDSGGKATRLDAELPAAAANATRPPSQKAIDDTSEIEKIGVGMLEQVRPMVDQIHHKLDLAPDEPLVDLLLADYVQNYGAEIWSVQYRVRQENLGNDFWTTRVLRPAYVQLYPPEKGQPLTFLEVVYPKKLSPLRLIEALTQHDPQLERIAGSSRETSEAMASIAAGNSTKAASGPVADFLRSALPAITGKQGSLVMAILDMNRGFQWLLPPQEPVPPAKTQPSEPEAPSLRNRGPRPQ